MNSRETLEALLSKNRQHEANSGPGKNNHVPMVLIALYRLGGGSKQMQAYVRGFDLRAISVGRSNEEEAIDPRNWRHELGNGKFPRFVEFFDSWARRCSPEAVLRESLPVLMNGVSSVAYHALLRLGYAVDYGSREELVSALAYWSSSFYPGPAFDSDEESAEPNEFLQDVVERTSALRIQPVGSIDGRIRQVYDGLATHWRPIKIPSSEPLADMSALIAEIFARSQHFTLLHGLTSCQALRFLLPYIGDVEKSLSQYFHSICAAYITVLRSSFDVGKDGLGPTCWRGMRSSVGLLMPSRTVNTQLS